MRDCVGVPLGSNDTGDHEVGQERGVAMCAPSVMGAVGREISRRRALGALVAPAVASTLVRPVEARRQGVILEGGFTTVYDLTHTLSAETPVFPAFNPIQIVERFTIASDGFYGNEITLDEHTGTHLDAPVHFAAGGLTTEQMPPEQFFAPLVVISITDRADRDPDTAVTVDDIHAWEQRHGRVPQGAFVAMNSGWDRRVGDSQQFLNTDADGAMHFPGFSVDAARLLTEDRDIVGVGVDTLSLDVGTSADFAAHLTFLPAGKYGLEVMANLDNVPPAGATLIVGAPKHLGGSGGPARVFAVS